MGQLILVEFGYFVVFASLLHFLQVGGRTHPCLEGLVIQHPSDVCAVCRNLTPY
jgi:hypothetical protein